MKDQSIHLKVRTTNPDDFEALFVTFFQQNLGSYNKLYIARETVYLRGNVDEMKWIIIPRHFFLAYNTEPHFRVPHREGELMVSESIKIAKIKIQQFNSFILVSIEKKERDDEYDPYDTYETSDDDWDKVRKFVPEIIFRAKQMEFDISVIQDKSISQNADKPWEEIEDHGADRDIIKMWYENKTVKEIATAIGPNHRTITNIISRLRVKYGKNIVTTQPCCQTSRWPRKMG